MKTFQKPHFKGFTLVELLVVIAIIAILAGAGFSGVTFAINKAKATTGLSVCTGTEKAVNDFFQEYGSMPIVEDADQEVKTDGTDADGMQLLDILLAREVGADIDNVRKIVFLEVKQGKGDKDGLIYDSSGSNLEGLFDPWGGPYFIMLDGDFDQQIDVKPTASAAKRTLNGRRVAMWSDGVDFEEGAAGKVTDDVRTW